MDEKQSQVWRSLSDDPGNFYCSASDLEKQRFKDWLQVLLKQQTIIVEFEKINGEFRSMKCTLNESLGAKYSHQNATERTRKLSPEVCVVWDTNQAAWRSFRWDRIKRITFDLG